MRSRVRSLKSKTLYLGPYTHLEDDAHALVPLDAFLVWQHVVDVRVPVVEVDLIP